MKSISAEGFSRIDLGHRGENFARQIIFDLAPWRDLYGDGSASLLAQLPEQSIPYPCSVKLDGDRLIWQISAADTSVAGKGKCELSYYVGEQLVKSAIFQTFIGESLADAGEIPEPYTSWVNDVLTAGNQAVTAKEAIENMSVSAETLAEDSSAGVIKSSTDNGIHLHFTIPRGEQGEKGIKGDKGDRGDKGDKGDAGSTGKNGADGYTPIRGVDYFTEEDFEYFDTRIDEKLGEIESSLDAILAIQKEFIGGESA